MSNELAKKETTDLATMPEGSWGNDEKISASDIVIPKLLLMQGLSDFVSEQKAVMGDIVDSLSAKKLGGKAQPVEIIPLMLFKTWTYSEKVGEKFEFRESFPMTPANESFALEGLTPEGVEFRRDKVMNFFVLLAADAKKVDAIPYVVSFRRTGYTTGKILATHFAMSQKLAQPPARKTFMLGADLEKGDKGNYYVFNLTEGKTLDMASEELKRAWEWYCILKKGQHKVDDSDLNGDATAKDVSGTSRF